jgi:hypothetical protein
MLGPKDPLAFLGGAQRRDDNSRLFVSVAAFRRRYCELATSGPRMRPDPQPYSDNAPPHPRQLEEDSVVPEHKDTLTPSDIAKLLGKRGGRKTALLHGKKHFSEAGTKGMAKRWKDRKQGFENKGH